MVRVLWSCRRSLTKLFILTIYFGTHETHYFPFVLRHPLHQSSQCNKVGREENIRLVLVVQVGLGIDALPLLVIAADNRSVDAVDGCRRSISTVGMNASEGMNFLKRDARFTPSAELLLYASIEAFWCSASVIIE